MGRPLSEKVIDSLMEQNPEALLCDGLNDALIGWCFRATKPEVAVYDYYKCIDIFMECDGMTSEEAIEHLHYNVIGAWVGENTPVFKVDCEGWIDLSNLHGRG